MMAAYLACGDKCGTLAKRIQQQCRECVQCEQMVAGREDGMLDRVRCRVLTLGDGSHDVSQAFGEGTKRDTTGNDKKLA